MNGTIDPKKCTNNSHDNKIFKSSSFKDDNHINNKNEEKTHLKLNYSVSTDGLVKMNKTSYQNGTKNCSVSANGLDKLDKNITDSDIQKHFSNKGESKKLENKIANPKSLVEGIKGLLLLTKTPTMRKITITVFLIWIMSGALYYGILLNASNFTK